MIRIHISAAAYAALARGVSADRLLEPEKSAQGGFFIWLDKMTLQKLSAARGPREGYSEAILRLASSEAA